MLLNLGTCHSRAGADARYSHYNILDDVIQRVLYFPPSPSQSLINVYRPWTVQTPAREDAIIAAVARQTRQTEAILHENWDYPNLRSSW
jgi:hypothetical protein